jgi:hypothetical protein
MPLYRDVHTVGSGVATADVAEAASTVHKEAHGLVADRVVQVEEGA